MRVVDLHTHSTASDGTISPTRLVEYAKEKGLSAIALTDHDTVAGLDEARAAGARLGVEVIPGIELTTVVEGRDVHLVGLYIDPEHPAITRELEGMVQGRLRRNRNIIAQLRAAGLEIYKEDMAQFGDAIITRGHIAKVLMDRGYVTTLQEAHDRYLSKGQVGYANRETPSPRACIDAVHRAGGLVFVAHVNRIHRGDPDHSLAICRQVLAAGADGLETLYCQYDSFWEEATEALAREMGVLRSGGSDYHGDIKAGLDLGTGYGGLAVPHRFLDAIRQRLGHPPAREES